MFKRSAAVVVAILALALPSLSGAQPHRSQGGERPGIASPGGASETLFDLPLSGGGVQRILYLAPSRLRGTIVMLPGGAGDVGLTRHGDIRHDDNFVVRTRDLWVARGYAVVIPDAADHENLRGLRSSTGYAALVRDFVTYAHAQGRGPVFLLGTSQGSIAAMNGAAHMGRAQIAGVVLTESVTEMGGSHETVFDAEPDRVSVPALVVANRDDRCNVAPPRDAPKIAAALSHSVQVRVLNVSGGVRRSQKDCGSLTPHGYYGIEATVVGDIANWMDAHS